MSEHRSVLSSIATVTLLLIVWPVGAVVLWLSPAWRPSEKLIGTLIIPGGLAVPLLLELGDRSACPLPAGGASAVATGACEIGPTYAWLHPGPEAFNHIFGALVFSAIVVLPLGAALFLISRLCARRA